MPPSVSSVYACIHVCVGNTFCAARVCLCLYVWIKTMDTTESCSSEKCTSVCMSVCLHIMPIASWNKCNHPAHTLHLSSARTCHHAHRSIEDIRSLESTLHEYITKLKAGICSSKWWRKMPVTAKTSVCVCVCFMVMSCQNVFCRQHLSVYAVLIVSRKTGGERVLLDIYTQQPYRLAMMMAPSWPQKTAINPEKAGARQSEK